MDANLFKTLGQVAGIGGLSLGVFLLLFRELIRKNIFPTLPPEDAYKLLRMITGVVWSVTILGIIAWVYTTVDHIAPNGGKGGTFTVRSNETTKSKLDVNTGGGNSACGEGGDAGNIDLQLGKTADSDVKAKAVGGKSGAKCN